MNDGTIDMADSDCASASDNGEGSQTQQLYITNGAFNAR